MAREKDARHTSHDDEREFIITQFVDGLIPISLSVTAAGTGLHALSSDDPVVGLPFAVLCLLLALAWIHLWVVKNGGWDSETPDGDTTFGKSLMASILMYFVLFGGIFAVVWVLRL